MNAHTTASGKKNRAAAPVLMPAILTFGGTPTMPIPFAAAAIVPAVCVPWPLSSFQAAGAVLGTPPTQETLLAKSTFGARSGGGPAALLACTSSLSLTAKPAVDATS